MKATDIAFAGMLLLALAGCNDEAAPVAKDTGQAEQVASVPAPAGGAVVATVPDAPAAAQQPNARLLHPTNLAPRTATRTVGAGVSARIDVFFDGLARYGSWVRHPDFSYVWLPGHQGRGWRPYQEGRWLWTDEHGWYWESAEPFAWAVYHYGRWSYDPDLGWFWVPGDTWAPAWVTWHHGGGRTGWAPIAPDRKGYALGAPRRFVPPVVEGWVFVDDRNFADPALGQYVLPIRQTGAMLGGASDVDASRGFRREDIERFGGRRLEKRELVYVGNDGDAFEDVRGGRIGIYRPMIEDGEARQPPHVIVTDVTRVDRVVIREFTEVRVAGAPSVVLLTVLDKNERQKLQDDRLNQQAAAVDTQIARLQQERAAVIEERRREAEHLQAQIDQERQEAALQRKQDQQRLMEARRQRAETITVDRTPPAAPATPAAQPAPVAAPAAPAAQPVQQAPARTVPPPPVATAPAAAKPAQTPAVATAPAAAPAATPPTAAPTQGGPAPEAKTTPGAATTKPVSPAAPAAPVAAPAKPVTPTEAKPVTPAAPPVAPKVSVAPAITPPVAPKVSVAPAPAPPVPPKEAKTTPAAPPVPPSAVPGAKDQKATQTAKEQKPPGKPASPAPKNAPPADGTLDPAKPGDPAR
ncbi:MAG TPA: DUF6600 domain-containing protein [Xanthobacteraceae bacterium]|jgi:hypothetical protein